ncbi:hypothetical protein OM076_11315 [Solirubrobacter ginsenosidimutans]|uniref:Uncharacterized protein n=1 Tax=Solirubrobacter ginsenosidimutans TaxID=490573 RepID=A0A9X3MQZ6_9ACTN|nr:hypothetical protein [Solirubrobacter ginsenosidimutans]MDA0160855.1 hypothetical protein [Solirubrobacter ginsenosidimutans]
MDDPRPTRVTRTGIALVHAGELMLPASGSEAEGEQVTDDTRAVITYAFPVEIEVRAAGAVIDADAIADRALARLARNLEGLA